MKRRVAARVESTGKTFLYDVEAETPAEAVARAWMDILERGHDRPRHRHPTKKPPENT